MEYTSVLAGETFSDHPRCTDPVLGMLARLVNDATTDRGRQRLCVIAPELTTASPTDAIGAARLVLTVLVDTYDALGRPRSLERPIRLARRRLRRVSDPGLTGLIWRWLEPVHRRGPGRHHLGQAVNASACLPEADRDAVLHAVLFSAVARHTAGCSPQGRRSGSQPPSPSTAAGPA